MQLVEQYRRSAEEAANLARVASDPDLRREWQAIARQWHELAEARAKAIGGGGAPSSHQ